MRKRKNREYMAIQRLEQLNINPKRHSERREIDNPIMGMGDEYGIHQAREKQIIGFEKQGILAQENDKYLEEKLKEEKEKERKRLEIREKEQKEKELREKELREKELREKELRERELREKEDREREMERKDRENEERERFEKERREGLERERVERIAEEQRRREEEMRDQRDREREQQWEISPDRTLSEYKPEDTSIGSGINVISSQEGNMSGSVNTNPIVTSPMFSDSDSTPEDSQIEITNNIPLSIEEITSPSEYTPMGRRKDSSLVNKEDEHTPKIETETHSRKQSKEEEKYTSPDYITPIKGIETQIRREERKEIIEKEDEIKIEKEEVRDLEENKQPEEVRREERKGEGREVAFGGGGGDEFMKRMMNDKYKMCLVQNKGVLFEDAFLQIGVIRQVRGKQAMLQMFIQNKNKAIALPSFSFKPLMYDSNSKFLFLHY